jgi:hypothetical protein
MAQLGPLEANGMRVPQLFPTLAAASCVFAGLVALLLSGFDSSGVDSARPIKDRRAVSPAAEFQLADLPPIAAARIVDAPVEAAAVPEVRAEAVTETPATPDKTAEIVVASLPEPSQMLPPDAPPVETVTANTPDPAPSGDEAVTFVEILDECFVMDVCVDHYLWALYQRADKVDTAKVHEFRKVTVKKKRKTVTVTRRFTRLVPQDFTWKDPNAAEKAGMPLMDYVIGGMDRDFKLRLFHALRAAEKAGHAPGITSGFRDDYRQSIASGLKAAANRSYHGGSLRGGYGNGVAADIVSVKGTTKGQRWLATVELWKWVDANETEFKIGRPYLHKDPPHVAPIDGEEYASRRGTKTQLAAAGVKKQPQPAVRNARRVAEAKKRNIVQAKRAVQTAKQAAPARRIASAQKRG